MRQAFPRTAGEPSGHRHQRRHRVAVRQPDAGVAAGQQQGRRIARAGEPRRRRRVRRRRRGRRRCRTRTGRAARPAPARPGSRVQLGRPVRGRRRWPPTRPDSGEATMLRTRSWVADGSRPAPRDALGDRVGVGDAADLDVAARRSVPLPASRTESARVRQRLELRARRSSRRAAAPGPARRRRPGAPAARRGRRPGRGSWPRSTVRRPPAWHSPRNGVARYSRLARLPAVRSSHRTTSNNEED